MCKRLWKNAILALCVLALVLQPVSSFALDYTYDNVNSFLSSISDYVYNEDGYSINQYANYSSTWPSGFDQDKFESYCQNLSINYSGCALFFRDDASYKRIYLTQPFTTFSYGSITNDLSSGSGVAVCVRQGIGYFNVAQNGDINGYSQQTQLPVGYSALMTTSSSSQYSFKTVGIFIYDGFTVVSASEADVRFIFDSDGGSGSSGDYSQVLSNIEQYSYQTLVDVLWNNFLYWNMNLTSPNKWRNSEWPAVGEALEYFMLCMQNPSDATVTYTVVDEENYTDGVDGYYGGQVTRTNFLYSLSGNIDAILDKLNLAFPNTQAAINDFIAEDLMDDTGDNGLTINRIASSKSDLDDGLDTFKLDTSQSQYNNPFSALGDADWSFWTQTTLNNLGSGYSYSFNEGSLMSEDDIFTENQNNLLNLLGW